MIITNQMPQTPGLSVNSKGSLKTLQVWIVFLITLNYLQHDDISPPHICKILSKIVKIAAVIHFIPTFDGDKCILIF